ncbi:helix-turn-helix transcriptional regulator [bacterium]|nr:helix-turn-helix transcriptional regulator [bacterium]
MDTEFVDGSGHSRVTPASGTDGFEVGVNVGEVDDVVKNVSLSKRELQRRFRQFTGRSIHATIVETRISMAKRLLGNPEYTIDYVAQLSGFSSRQHFAKTFKAATGFTPGAFRKNHSLR